MRPWTINLRTGRHAVLPLESVCGRCSRVRELGSSASTPSSPQSPCRYQSSPISSAGCRVRPDPLPHISALVAQYLSHPQHSRSGCFGLRGNFLATRVVPEGQVFSMKAQKIQHYGSNTLITLNPSAENRPMSDLKRAGILLSSVNSLIIARLSFAQRAVTSAARLLKDSK